MPRKKYTREFLEPIVARSQSLADLMRNVGITPNGGNHRMMNARIREAGIDISHFGPTTIRDRIAAIPDNELRKRVAASTSIAAVCQAFGIPDVGRPHYTMSVRVRDAQIDTAHM